MTSPRNKGRGRGIVFIRKTASYTGDECIIWPYFIDPDRGYGPLSLNGKMTKAHRVMCDLVNGPPPTPDHEAAHSCGKGRDGCITPRHLSWKTRVANQADRKEHGTAAGNGARGKLTKEIVNRIKKQLGRKPKSEIAIEFGVDRSTIRQIEAGKIWNTGKTFRRFTEDEIAAIRNLAGTMTYDDLASMFNASRSSVWNVAKRNKR
jgi:hypothetical protein